MYFVNLVLSSKAFSSRKKNGQLLYKIALKESISYIYIYEKSKLIDFIQ